MKKEKKIERDIYAGCYGPKLSYAAIQNYLLDAFQADSWAEKNNPHERFATAIWGNAGCAKTSLVRMFSNMPVEWEGKKYEGYNVVYVPLAQYEEMGDLLGLPARHVCMRLGVGKKCEWIPEDCIEGYKNLGWELCPEAGIRTICAPPAWVPCEDRPTILLIDDWNRASLRILKGCMQLLQTYGTATWKLPKGSHIVLTGNPDSQDYQVTSIDGAVLTRIRHVTMVFDVNEWSVWAQKNGVDGRGINWALAKGAEEMIGQERTNPRTISECFRMTAKIGDLNVDENEIRFRNIAASMLDDETVTSIVLYMQSDVGLVADPAAIVTGTFDDIEGYVNNLMSPEKGGEVRTDIVGIMCQRVYAYIASDQCESKPAYIKNFQKFITIASIPKDLKFSVVNRLLSGDNNKKTAIWTFNNPEINKILGKLFNQNA